MKKLLIMAAAAVMSLLAACGGGGGDGPSHTPPPTTSSSLWTRLANLLPYQFWTSYVATVQKPGGGVKFFFNPEGSGALSPTSANLYSVEGTFDSLSQPKVEANFGNRTLRTVAVARDDTGTCYMMAGMTEIGKGYGQGSYYPTSGKSGPDCNGMDITKEKVDFINTNSMAYTVLNGPVNAPINDANPRANKFTFLTDGAGARMALMYSNDNVNYKKWTDASGNVKEVLPPDLWKDNLTFAAEAKAKFNYYLIAVKWDNSKEVSLGIVLLRSCNGLEYTTIETDSPIATSTKGVSLSVNEKNEVVAVVKNGEIFKLTDVQICQQQLPA